VQDALEAHTPRAREHGRLHRAAVALGGGTTAYAAAKLTGADIVDESLTGADIQNGSLSAADISIAAAFGSNNADNPLPHVAEVLASANITLARRSTLVVLGHSDGLVVCGEPAPDSTLCQVNVGLYLDGNPIPASAGNRLACSRRKVSRSRNSPCSRRSKTWPLARMPCRSQLARRTATPSWWDSRANASWQSRSRNRKLDFRLGKALT
jgi:hypothetical protein